MSNTIRRKTVKTPEWYHTNRTRETRIAVVSKPGTRQWMKEENMFHSDKFQPDSKVEKQVEREFKAAAKREIKKAMNDPEYEVQVRRDRYRGWW